MSVAPDALAADIRRGRNDSRRNWGWLLLCVLASLAAPLAIRPFFKSGFNDDFSYTMTALSVLKTGRPVYNGWAAAMLGVQAYWGAAFAAVFGPSFVAVRMSTLPLAGACGGLLFVLMRDAGLSASMSAFVACTTMISPLTVPLSASFMTDVPGFFGLLLTLWLGLRAARRPGRAGLLWAGGCAAVGVMAATVRQTNLIAACCALLPLVVHGPGGKRRGVAALLIAAVVLAYAGLNAWYQRQPFAIHESLADNVRMTLANPKSAAGVVVQMYFTGILLLLPVLLRPRPTGKLWRWQAVAGVFVATYVLVRWLCPWTFDSPYQLWRSNMFAATGMYVNIIGGTYTFVVPDRVVLVISLFVGLVHCMWTVGALSRLAERPIGGWGRAASEKWRRLPIVMQVWLAFTAVYLPLICLRAAADAMFDRYLLPVLPAIAWCALRAPRRQWAAGRTAAAIAAVLLASYALVNAESYARQLQTRSAAEDLLVSQGVDPLDIRAGFEHDGYKQILAWGHLNDPRLRSDEYVRTKEHWTWTPPSSGLWNLTPAVRGPYLLLGAPYPGYVNVPGSPFVYHDLFGLRERQIFIERRAPSPPETRAAGGTQ